MTAFDWSQYFVLAKELSTRSEESALRSAMSRAYYAAYNTAEIYCNQNNIPIINTGNSHQDVWDAFLKRGGQIFTTVYDKGTRLKRKRKLADYKDEITGLPSLVSHSISEANDILSYLKPSASSGVTPPTTAGSP